MEIYFSFCVAVKNKIEIWRVTEKREFKNEKYSEE